MEFSAKLHDLVHEDLLCLYPHLKDSVTITLVQSGDHILNTFDKRISQFAKKKFRRDRVHVKIGCCVLEVTNKHIRFKSKDTGKLVDVPYGMIMWAIGKWFICCSGILNVRTSCSVKQHNQTVTIFDR